MQAALTALATVVECQRRQINALGSLVAVFTRHHEKRLELDDREPGPD